MSTQLDSPNQLPLLARLRLNVSRLLRRKSLTIPAAIAVLTKVSGYLDLGTKVLDWAQRYDYLKGRTGVLFDILKWLLSPRGLDFLFIIAFIVLLIAIILTVNSSVGESRGTVIRKSRSREPAQTLEILTPLHGRDVGWRQIVRGSVFPSDSDVQVLVYSPDGLWYVQGPVVVKDCAWSCRCQFGVKEKAGLSYEIVAAFGKSLKLEKYEHLPESLTKSKVITVNRKSDEDIIDCPDKRLHQTKIDDKSVIKDMVKVCGVNCELQLEGDEPHVSFVVCFVNLSLFPISVESVTGFMTYQKDGCDETVGFEYPPKLTYNDHALSRGFRDTGGWLRIRQNLAPWEIARTANGSKESVFYFHKLDIWITGDGFEPVRLDVDRVQKGISWVARHMTNECDFVYARIAETKAKFLELETERDSLKSQLDELKEPEKQAKKSSE
jgi:hypothetical protein